MRAMWKTWGLLVVLLWSLFGVSLPAHAGTASLQVCNHGKIAVDVYVAQMESTLSSQVWEVKSARILPGTCAQPYLRIVNSDRRYDANPAYIAFAFADSHGQWVAGKFEQVPGLGFVNYGVIEAKVKGAAGHAVLIRGEKKLCVRRGPTTYRVEGDFERDCATFQTHEGDRGQYLPLMTAFYFAPESSFCSSVAGQYSCAGGEYYLNVAAVPSSRVMAAERGSEHGGGTTAVDPNSEAAKELRQYTIQQHEQEAAQAKAARDAEDANWKKRREAAAAKGDVFSKQVLESTARDEQELKKKWSAPRRSPGAYDAAWMDENVVIRGTVARVDIKDTGVPTWVTIYFKESPDGKFAVCSPNPMLFREMFGREYWNDLVGRTLEVEGRVEAPYCGAKAGSVRVVELDQMRTPSANEPYAKYTAPTGPPPVRTRPTIVSHEDLLRAQEHPAKIGKVEVNHLAGLAFADLPQRLTRVYGQPPVDGAEEQRYGPGGHTVVRFAKFQGGVLRVKHVEVERSDLEWVRAHVKKACGMATHCDDDALLDLMGKSESAIVAVLGPPKRREPQGGDAYSLYWSFAMAGYPAGDATATSDQTLRLGFSGSGCSSIAVTW